MGRMAESAARPTTRVVVMGHAGHGKSALIDALVGRSTRAVDGRSALALFETPTASHRTAPFDGPRVDHVGVDLRGGRRWVRHAGVFASCADGCLLVVSAVDGVMAQTREHAHLARAFTPGGAVGFVSHCDRAMDPEQVDIAEMELREALYAAGYDGDSVTVVRGAVPPDGVGEPWSSALDALLDAVDRDIAPPAADLDAPLVATVMHRWREAMRGAPVVELSVREGSVTQGATVAVLGRDAVTRVARVVGVRVQDVVTQRAEAGEVATVALSFDASQRPWWRYPRLGDLVVATPPPALAPALAVNLQMLSTTQGGRRTAVFTGYRASAWIGGRVVNVALRLPEAAPMLREGEAADVTLELDTPTLAPPGTALVLRDGSHDPSDAVAREAGVVAVGTVKGVATAVGVSRAREARARATAR